MLRPSPLLYTARGTISPSTLGLSVMVSYNVFRLGKGSVMTGTVLAGAIKVNDMVEIPALKVERKVKSLQMFHKPAQVRIWVFSIC